MAVQGSPSARRGEGFVYSLRVRPVLIGGEKPRARRPGAQRRDGHCRAESGGLGDPEPSLLRDRIDRSVPGTARSRLGFSPWMMDPTWLSSPNESQGVFF